MLAIVAFSDHRTRNLLYKDSCLISRQARVPVTCTVIRKGRKVAKLTEAVTEGTVAL